VGYSTIVSVANQVSAAITSPISSAAPAAGSSAVIVRQVGMTFDSSNALRVNVVEGTISASTTADVFVRQSTAADLQATVTPASTVWAVQAAPINIATPVSSAAPAANSSAVIVRQVGMTFDSSNALQVNVVEGTITASTTAGVNSTLVAIAPGYLSSAAAPGNSSALLVRVVGGASSAADFLVRPVFSSTHADNPVSIVGNSTVHLGSIAAGLLSTTAPAAGSSGLIVRQVGHTYDSSGALNVNAGTLTASTTAGVDSTLAKIGAGYLSSAAVAANSSALNVRVVGGTSSGADFPVRALLPSTAADNPVVASQASTTWAVQISGQVRVGNSTSGDLLANVAQQSTTWAVQAAISGNSTVIQGTSPWIVSGNSSIAAFPAAMVSTSTPAHGSSALLVRQVLSSRQSLTTEILSSNSTALYTVVSSVAAERFVYAYSVTSTTAVPSTLILMTGSTTHLWGVGFGSGSSGVTGANLSVSPPGPLLTIPAGGALQAVIQSASTGQSARISVSWFT